MRSCVSTSSAEPNAISKKWANSASDGLAHPSAIFKATDTTARYIGSQIPFFSNQGISLVLLIYESGECHCVLPHLIFPKIARLLSHCFRLAMLFYLFMPSFKSLSIVLVLVIVSNFATPDLRN